MRSSRCCLVVLLMLAAGEIAAQDVWRGLSWDLSQSRASQTLARQGLKVSEHGPRKAPGTSLSTKVDGGQATVYFDEQGRMNQITVIAEGLTQEAAAAAKERLTKRFGAVKDTLHRTERTWGARLGANSAWAKFLVVRMPDDQWFAREEHGCGTAGTPLGIFDLTCGQSAPDVEQRLHAAGFEARTTGLDVDPCKMPNPPPLCEPDVGVIVHFQKGDHEGTADVDHKRGLVQLRFTARVASYADGLAHVKPIEALRGPASEIEDATITKWGDATADVSLDIRESQPKGTRYAVEIYSPPGMKR